MTVQSTITSKTFYPGAAMATQSLAGLIFIDPEHVQVWALSAGGAPETLLARDEHYALTGDGVAGTASITPIAAWDGDVRWMVQRRTEAVQPEQFPVQEPLSSEAIERGLNRQALIAQEQRAQLGDVEGRALLVPFGESAQPLPTVVDRGNQFLAFDAAGVPIPASGTGADAGLRADVASATPGKGIDLLGRVPYPVTSVAQLKALDTGRYTTAILKVAGKEGIFNFVAGNYAARVTADVREGVFIKANAVVTTAGAWVRENGGVLRPEWFGDIDTPAIAHLAVQAAFDLTRVVAAKVVIPNRVIETKYPLYGVDFMEVVGEGPLSRIRNTLTTAEDAENVKRITLIGGELHPAYLASNTNGDGNPKVVYFTWRVGGAIADQSYSITLTTAAQAAEFSPGDKVYVRGQAYYRGSNKSEIVHYGIPNIVISSNAGTGVVTFKYPFRGNVASSYICNFTTANVLGMLGDAGRYVGPMVGAKISGVTLESTDITGNAMARSCPLDCDIDISIEGATGLYLNGASYNRITQRVRVFDKVLEFAMTATGNAVRCYAKYYKRSGASAQPPIKIGECANFNTVDLWLDAGDLNSSSGDGVIDFQNGDGNTVTVHAMNAPQHAGALFRWGSVVRTTAVDAGSTQEPHRDNRVVLQCSVIGGAQNRSFYVIDAADTITNCGLVGGRVYGTPSISAISFARGADGTKGGTGCYVDNTWFEAGSITSSLTTGAMISVLGGAAMGADAHLGCRQLRIAGVDQHAQGAAISHGGGAYSLNLSIPVQTITVTATGIAFSGPTTASQIGATALVTLINASGGAFTPTFGANYNLNGWTPVSIANGETITFMAKRVPSASTRVVILNPTPPL